MTDVEHDFIRFEIGVQFILTELNFAHHVNYMRHINYILLIAALTKKLSLIRRSTVWAKEQVCDILSRVCYILHEFSEYRKMCIPTVQERKLREYNCTISGWLEPLDQAQMTAAIVPDINVLHVIKNYETYCFPIHLHLRINPRWEGRRKKFTCCAYINRESFIRHMILHATADEFKSYVYGLTELYYSFGWASQLEAYENVVRITTDAIQLTMVYPKTFSPNASITLMRLLVKFCKKFAKESDASSHEAICRILLKALFSLKQLMHGTRYSVLYNYLFINIGNMFVSKSYTDIESYFRNIKEWIQACFGPRNNRRTITEGSCQR